MNWLDYLGLKEKSVQISVALGGNGSTTGAGEIKKWVPESVRYERTGNWNPFTGWEYRRIVIPAHWSTMNATTTEAFGISGELIQGYTVDCETGQIKKWKGTPTLIGATARSTTVEVGPIDVTNTAEFDTGSGRASDAMNVAVTYSNDGNTKAISWDVDGTAVISVKSDFKISGVVNWAGWEVGAGFSKSSTHRSLVTGSSSGSVTCNCDPETGEFE